MTPLCWPSSRTLLISCLSLLRHSKPGILLSFSLKHSHHFTSHLTHTLFWYNTFKPLYYCIQHTINHSGLYFLDYFQVARTCYNAPSSYNHSLSVPRSSWRRHLFHLLSLHILNIPIYSLFNTHEIFPYDLIFPRYAWFYKQGTISKFLVGLSQIRIISKASMASS